MKNKILDISYDFFNKRGVKSVTMDDIAHRAGISKKTLYEEFESKSQLVYETLKRHIEEISEALQEIDQASTNAMECWESSLELMNQNLQMMYPEILTELYRYYPKSYEYLENFRSKLLVPFIARILQKGQEEGLFMEDIDASLLARFRVDSIFLLMERYNAPGRYSEMLSIKAEMNKNFIRGLLTNKGRMAYEKIRNIEDDVHQK